MTNCLRYNPASGSKKCLVNRGSTESRWNCLNGLTHIKKPEEEQEVVDDKPIYFSIFYSTVLLMLRSSTIL